MNNVDPTFTVQQWLDSIGNKALPFEDKLPNEKEYLVRYAQAWHAGYIAQPKGRNSNVNNGGSKFDKEDLILTHPKHPYALYDKYCLTTVNGYFHITDYTELGIRVVDGNRTVRRANNNQIGVYSFETVGALTKIPITREMILPQKPGAPLSDAMYLKIPASVNMTGKVPMLITGGYLQTLGRTFLPVADNMYRVEIGPSLMLDRYIQSIRELDIDNLGLTIDPKNPTLLSTSEMFSDETMYRYMTMSQSFLVLVETPSLFQEYIPIESLRLPGRFIDASGDNLPLVGAYGRMLDYHTIKETDTFVYAAVDNIRHDYNANHTNWESKPFVDGQRYPAFPWWHDDAFFRVIGTN
jgi:hypothetical protein